jgi:hypothetical protein
MRVAEAALLTVLISLFGCSPPETEIAAEHGRPNLDLVALHSEGIAPGSQNLDDGGKALIGGLCGDIGADISMRLRDYFFASHVFSWGICSLLALICGWLAALVYWKLARKRRAGWSSLFLCLIAFWFAAGSLALIAHWYYVRPQMARAVAAHRTLLRLAQETWIPKSTNESVRDFSANCSDRLEDIALGAQYGDKALGRYPTLFRSREELPSASTNPVLYWAVIQSRAKDMGELYAVDSGFGRTRRVAASWSGVLDTNSRFRAVTDQNGGWLIHSDLHPAGLLILFVGIPLIAWIHLWRWSRTVRKQTIRDIEGKA